MPDFVLPRRAESWITRFRLGDIPHEERSAIGVVGIYEMYDGLGTLSFRIVIPPRRHGGIARWNLAPVGTRVFLWLGVQLDSSRGDSFYSVLALMIIRRWNVLRSIAAGRR